MFGSRLEQPVPGLNTINYKANVEEPEAELSFLTDYAKNNFLEKIKGAVGSFLIEVKDGAAPRVVKLKFTKAERIPSEKMTEDAVVNAINKTILSVLNFRDPTHCVPGLKNITYFIGRESVVEVSFATDRDRQRFIEKIRPAFGSFLIDLVSGTGTHTLKLTCDTNPNSQEVKAQKIKFEEQRVEDEKMTNKKQRPMTEDQIIREVIRVAIDDKIVSAFE